MLRRLLGVIGVAILLIAAAFTTAYADATAPKAPSPACLWCGFYLGGNAGWAWGSDAVSTTSSFPSGFGFQAVDVAAINTAASPTLDSNGLVGGVQAGYAWQFGHAVFGIEADADFPSLKNSQAGTFPFPSTLPGGVFGPPTVYFNTMTTVSTDWLVTVRPRVGWAVNNWLLYVTGGLAVGREDFTQTVNLVSPYFLSDTFSATQAGWTAGGGLEVMPTPNWSLRAEYLYVDLGTTPANSGLITPPFGSVAFSNAMRLTTSMARVGLDYHFNDAMPLFEPVR
jgi:outer membrane immunogenic protein